MFASPVLAGGLRVLESTFAPLKNEFNAKTEELRFIAILSPTCRHCLHGARAIASEIVDRYDGSEVDVTIVWSPMMKKDDEAAARESAKMFDGERVAQFYDPERLIGYLYHFDVFPRGADQMEESIPHEHPFHDVIAERAQTERERPEWDLYMWFEPGKRWKKDAPEPWRFIRHVAHWDEDGKKMSLMWIDDLAEPPVVDVLGDRMGAIMRSLRPRD